MLRMQTPVRVWLAALTLLALLALAPVAEPLAQAERDTQGLVEISERQQIDALATYVVEVIDKVQRYHPAGASLDRQALVDGARDAVAAALAQSEAVPRGQRDELVGWMREQSFRSIAHMFGVLHDFSSVYSTLDLTAMADVAARGVIAVTNDPFSRLMTMEEMQRMQQQMLSPEDRSLGIAPRPIPSEDGTLRLKVGHLRRGYLGFEMGLLGGDEILAVNGRRIADVPRHQIEELLQADVGERVTIEIRRDGFDEPIVLQDTQRSLVRPAASGIMLPGDIGYVATNMFTLDFHTVVRREVQRFTEQRAVGLILDLRNNPGGAMNACTALADDFLERGAVITYTKGTYRPPLPARMLQRLLGLDDGERVDDETTVYRAGEAQRFTLPLVVLINDMSASASEMLAGALKSHERAVIVGETTYGKGIGQTAVLLSSGPGGENGGMLGMLMGGGGGDMRMLFMTVMTYFGPNWEDVHEIGVSPNVEVPMARPDGPIFDRIARLRASGAVESYVSNMRREHAAFLRAQVQGTPASFAAYPQAERLREHEAAAGMSDDTLAREVRRVLRRQYDAAADYADDNQLQAAILEVAKLAGLELEGIDEYRHFGD